MKFRDHMPDDCPPDDAERAAGRVYRMIQVNTPTADDFLSFRELKPGRSYPSNCIASGLSIYTEQEGIRRLRARVPRFRKMRVAEGQLNAEHGKMKNTPSRLHHSHHTWWVAADATPETDFTVITLKGDHI